MTEYFEHCEFNFEWNELEGALGLGDCLFDFSKLPINIIFWKVEVYAEIDEATQTHSATLEQPEEHECTYKLNHIDLSLILQLPNGTEQTLMIMEEWEGWEEFENIKKEMDSIDWSEVHV